LSTNPRKVSFFIINFTIEGISKTSDRGGDGMAASVMTFQTEGQNAEEDEAKGAFKKYNGAQHEQNTSQGACCAACIIF
jgi:hypothetical protein